MNNKWKEAVFYTETIRVHSVEALKITKPGFIQLISGPTLVDNIPGMELKQMLRFKMRPKFSMFFSRPKCVL